jgi:hypothetical protein
MSGLIGSDFVLVILPLLVEVCPIRRRVRHLGAIRMGKVQKRVCSNECRLEFDNRYWQDRAQQRKETA